MYRMSCIECHVSNVMYRMSCIECHVSNVRGQNLGEFLGEGLGAPHFFPLLHLDLP